MSAIPIYRKVYAELKEKIKDGTYRPGTLLPTESELEKSFQVSRTTVRKAVELLVQNGFIKVRQGHGTEILDISTTQKLNHITSITETLTNKGYKVTTQGMCIELVRAPAFVASALEIPEGDPVYQIQRVQCADNQPIAMMNNYIKEKVAPGLEAYSGTFVGLYAFLEERYKIVFQDATERLSAVSADFSESQILKVPFGAPLLCSKRVSFNEQGPFEYSIIKLVADKYEYSVYLHGRR